MDHAPLQFGEWLGVRAPATESQVLQLVEERLSPSVITRLASLGLDRAEIDAAVIPSRTL
jgi:hypothetical protein